MVDWRYIYILLYLIDIEFYIFSEENFIIYGKNY